MFDHDDRPARSADTGFEQAMNEPGIFKGCHDTHGPLTPSTKDAIIGYLGRPRAEAWEIIKHTAVMPGITLGEVWRHTCPLDADRIPDANELVRSIRLAVTRERRTRS